MAETGLAWPTAATMQGGLWCPLEHHGWIGGAYVCTFVGVRGRPWPRAIDHGRKHRKNTHCTLTAPGTQVPSCTQM
jgi:hypothetical protein